MNEKKISGAVSRQYHLAVVEKKDAEIARLRAENDELDEQCTKRILEIYKLQAEKEELTEALESLAALYADDIGMGSFPAATQVECKSTTLDVIRKARAALAKVKGE